MSYTVIITEEVAANIAVTTQNYPITIEYNATNLSGGGSYGNANVAAYLASGTNTSVIDNIGNISTTGSMAAGGIMIATGNVTGGNIRTAGQVSATGNITASYFLGNGSQLTGITANYSNANVQAYLPTYSGNIGALTVTGALNSTAAVSAVGNVTGGNVITTGIVYTPQVEATGDLDLNTAGKVNVNGNVRVGDNNQNTQIATMGTGDLILRTHEGDANQGSITIFDGANGNIALAPNGTGQVTAGTISASGNVTAAYVVGNGSALTSLTGANVSGTVANATYATSAGSATTATSATTANTVTDAAQGNITSVGTLTSLSVSGNITGGSVVVPNGSKYRGDFTSGATAGRSVFQTTDTNTTAATFVSAIPGPNHTASPGTIGSATGLFSSNDAGNASIFGMYSYPTDAVIRSLSAGTGNINDITFKFGLGSTLAATITQGGNVVAVGNLQSSQQTVVGTANVGTTGNIVISGKNIATDMAWNPDGANAAAGTYGRVLIGTGWYGNTTHTSTQSRLQVSDVINRSATSTNVRQLDVDSIVNLTGNVTNSSFRQQGIGSRVRVGGGSAGNTTALSGAGGTPGSIAALQPNIDIGNASPYFLGNTTVSHATLNGGFFTTYIGSNVGNAYGMLPGALAAGTGNAQQAGNITNYIGFASQLSAAPYITGNLYAFYNGNLSASAEANATGVSMAAAVRTANNYYFLRNDDDVAQNKIGSLRSYHEYQYALATSGTVNIDKSNSQVQYLAPTANVTIGSLSNFVTNASDGTNNDPQSDTVTLIIKQGATPYTVTMPTGNASIKYASGNSTVGTTANAVTMINITGSNIGGAAMYLVTVSPEFT